jgi:hypothetical protein
MSASVSQIIPLQATASQTVNVVLGSQSCTINVYEKLLAPVQQSLVTDTGLLLVTNKNLALDVTQDVFSVSSALFLDLYVNDAPIVTGVIGLNLVGIVRDAYLGFTGELYFWDTQGLGDDPTSAGLGGRFSLVWQP